ncbi:MAG: zinc metalloprotease HtpX [Patescibacteria group bacterium]
MINRIKTTLLLGGLTALTLAIGYYFGGQNGAFIALIFSIIMNFGSYWFSDKIVLAIYGAKEITQKDNPRLHEILRELSQEANLPKPRLYNINMPIPNAFATGRNENHAVVAITSGILKLLNEKELRGVLAHELSHIKNKDILISSIAATLAGAISYLAQMAYFAGIFAGGSRDDSQNNGNAFGTLALFILAPIIATLLHLAISRSREYIADETGAHISKDPLALAEALKKLHGFSRAYPLIAKPKYEATAHLFIVNPFKPSFLMSLFSTHPPVEERVKRLEAIKIPH